MNRDKVKINIIKAVNNNRFVSKKDEKYYEIGYRCKRIWLDNKLDMVADKNIVYSIKTQSGQSFKGVIVDSGKDDLGDFIVIDSTEEYMHYEAISFSSKRIVKGAVTMIKLFSPYDIEGGKELVEACDGWWPDFHDVEFIVNRKGNDITLNMKNVLYFEVNLKMINVIEEKFVGEECTSFEDFYNKKINDIKINRDEQGIYKVVVNNSYKEYIPKERNEEGVPIEYTVEEHIDEGIILCEDLKIDYENCFLKGLKDKGITYTEIKERDVCDIKAEMLRERWINLFTKDVDTENIYFDNFLWHVFSYKRLECQQGVEADKAFNGVQKNNLYIFFNEGEVVYKLNNSEKLTFHDLSCFEGIMYYEDAYIVDEDFTWTYVRTHESECGPYFVER